MDLRQLESFVRIARLGGFRRAANDLGLSQAAISEQIKLLEAELRVPLFERAHRPVRLTEAGQTLLQRTELVLSELRATREELEGLAGLEGGHVRVGTLPSHGAPWTAPMLGAFHRRHPGVEIDLAEQTSAILLKLLVDREIDLACLNIPTSGWDAPKGVSMAPLGTFEYVLAVHPRHRLASYERVRLEELAPEPLLITPHSSLEWSLERVFRARGLVPHVRLRVSDTHTLLELVAEGMGVGVTARYGVATHSGLALHSVSIEDAVLTGRAVVAWTEQTVRAKVVEAFVQHAQAWAHDRLTRAATFFARTDRT